MIILQFKRPFYIIDDLDIFWRSHYGADFSHDWAASADSGDFGSQCRNILQNFYTLPRSFYEMIKLSPIFNPSGLKDPLIF